MSSEKIIPNKAKEILRKQITKFLMWETNKDALDKAKVLLDYILSHDTRNLATRKFILKHINELKDINECDYCSKVFSNDEPIRLKWGKNSNIEENRFTTKEMLIKALQEFIENEFSEKKEIGKNILDEINNIDLRKKEDQQNIINKIEDLSIKKECETCDSLSGIKEEMKKRFSFR